MILSVGDSAPEFSLPDQDKQVVSLAELRGSPVLLVFYPFAFSGLCTGELCRLRDELSVYTDGGVSVLAISTDPVFSLKAFREKEGFDFPLLSDFWPHGVVAQAYGVFNEKAGMALRGTFLVDGDGTVSFAEVNPPGDVREQSGWKDAVGQLAAEEGPRPPPTLRKLRAVPGTGPLPWAVRARSSAEELSAYNRAVAGSNPAAPTRSQLPRRARLWWPVAARN